MRRDIPKEFEEENEKIIRLYVDLDDVTPDEVVDKYASKAFKAYYYKEKKRMNALRKKGIYV